MTPRFQPHEDLLRQWQRRVVHPSDGRPVSTVAWDPWRGCLSVWKRTREEKWRWDRELRDDLGRPRNIRSHDIAEELEAMHDGKNGMVFFMLDDGTWDWIPKVYAEVLTDRRQKRAEIETRNDDAREQIANKVYDRYHGLGYASTVSTHGSGRDWSRYQDVCMHDVCRATCKACRPDKPVPFYRSGKGRGRDGRKGRTA